MKTKRFQIFLLFNFALAGCASNVNLNPTAEFAPIQPIPKAEEFIEIDPNSEEIFDLDTNITPIKMIF